MSQDKDNKNSELITRIEELEAILEQHKQEKELYDDDEADESEHASTLDGLQVPVLDEMVLDDVINQKKLDEQDSQVDANKASNDEDDDSQFDEDDFFETENFETEDDKAENFETEDDDEDIRTKLDSLEKTLDQEKIDLILTQIEHKLNDKLEDMVDEVKDIVMHDIRELLKNQK